eukprot:1534445-Rhodomonas_salina.1
MADQAAPSAAIRQDQVQNAVAFLTHKKVQGSSMEERRKFLVKKGLTEEEIDEAVKIAQPEIDKQKAAEEASQPASGMFATPAAPPQAPVVAQPQVVAPISSVVAQPQPVPGNSASWGKVLLASAAVVGLGSGLGLLAKKYVIPHLLRAGQPASASSEEQGLSTSSQGPVVSGAISAVFLCSCCVVPGTWH